MQTPNSKAMVNTINQSKNYTLHKNSDLKLNIMTTPKYQRFSAIANNNSNYGKG